MSSVSEAIAKKVASNNGVYVSDSGECDPQCFAVFKIRNRYFGHEHHVIAYDYDRFEAYAIDHEVTEILWTKDQAKIDELNQRMIEDQL